MPAVYEKLGIQFSYPENWSLDEAEAAGGGDCVTLYTPGGGFWSVSIQPASTDPGDLCDATVETMRAEYEDLEVSEANEELESHQLTGYDMNFYCLDLTSTAQVRAVTTPSGTLVILCQAEDHEFDEMKLVFRAITASLLREAD